MTTIGREPLEPDANGYCYTSEQHFDETLARVARDDRARRTGGAGDRFVPHFLLLMALVTVVAWLVTQQGLILVATLTVSILFVFRFARSEARHARRVEKEHLCFQCGYSLRNLPTGEADRGRCPECGLAFRQAFYRRPPPMYEAPRGVDEG